MCKAKPLAQVRAKLTAGEKQSIEETPTRDLAAYDFYVRAAPLIDNVPSSSTQEKDLSAAVDLLDPQVEGHVHRINEAAHPLPIPQ